MNKDMAGLLVEGFSEALPIVLQLIEDHQIEEARLKVEECAGRFRMAELDNRAQQIQVISRTIATLSAQHLLITEALDAQDRLSQTERQRLHIAIAGPLQIEINKLRKMKQLLSHPGKN